MRSKHNSKLLVVVILLLSNIYWPWVAHAQPRVVVIPLGENSKPLANIITVAKSNGAFTDPVAAMDSISDAASDKPYLIVIAPGIYDLSGTLTVKPFVSVQGSGKAITTLRTDYTNASSTTGTVVTMLDNSSISDLSVRMAGSDSSQVVGVTGDGTNIIVRSVEIDATNSTNSSRSTGFAIKHSSSATAESGTLDNVDFIVNGGSGIGNPYSSSSAESLSITNSRFMISNGGTGISGAGLSISNNSILLVSGTRFDITDSGLAVSNTDGKTQLFQSILIRSDSDGVVAFSGAGSGFIPRIENSQIILNGSNSIGFKTNNGSISLESSYIKAAIGFTHRGASSTWTPQYYVNHSTIDGSVAVKIDIPGGNLSIRFGASQIKSLNILDAVNGTISATCAATYNRNFADLNASCN